MRKTELNEIIKGKIVNLKESENMKQFLFSILHMERHRTQYTQSEYMTELISLAKDLSQKEKETD